MVSSFYYFFNLIHLFKIVYLTCFVSFLLTYINRSIKCDAGKAAGTNDTSKCESCTEGRYRNATMGAATCFICPAGWSSDIGSTKCRECQVGRFNGEDGKSCTDCSKGWYRNSSMATTKCGECGIGEDSSEGSTRW